jgi:hypothetical protein
MFNTAIKFGTYPRNVQKAISCLTLGWIAHFIVYFGFLPGGALARSDYLMLVVGFVACYFVAGINNWARLLSLFGNIIIFLNYLPLVLVFNKAGFGLQVLTTAVIVLFALATYYLLLKDTAEFFRSFNADKAGNEKQS